MARTEETASIVLESSVQTHLRFPEQQAAPFLPQALGDAEDTDLGCQALSASPIHNVCL